MRDFARHPVAGSGAGTFAREWYRQRTIRANVTDAHSLYVETLAELGLVGLALVLFVVAVPAVAAVRVRGAPFVACVLGAFAAFAAHGAVDWDWELPAVTLAGLFCGGLLVVAARSDDDALVLDRRWRTRCSRRCSRSSPCLSSVWWAIVPRQRRSRLRRAATGARLLRKPSARAPGRPGRPRRSS